MDTRASRLGKWGGFALGVALCAPLFAGWSVGGGTAPAGARIALAPQRSSTLEVLPVVEPLARRTLVPSLPAAGLGGVITARNATAETLAVTLRAGAETHALDSLLLVRVTARGRTVFAGTLGSLRRGVALGLLPSHETLSVRVRAWLPLGASSGYAARDEEISLSFATRSERGS